ncbi:cytochrome c oxidase subunit II [Edaphosphingomonas haloaromaticamans]|uniref:Cytochrome c oxidase subunit 2 n=1 Tax=Edaphosphingomonas haloaromaticamans TaxID=653954 RepID=A0A1S1HA97_9SPHN|nr:MULTISPECIES: cytochrome c oxidase subunit II [Sphingomonas]MDX3883752.1 cytochrome c oxidase subunit II [Sphingomonas sp.]OHT18998.1 Cytochrome c oxidase subunit 2 precursor [Sphingomonas haloaromaticamans]
MSTLKTMLMAFALAATPAAALAQGAPAPVAAQTAAAPAAAATAAPESAKPAFQHAAPEADIGQPIPGGWKIQPQVTALGEDGQWLHNSVLVPIITAICVFVLALMLWVIVRYRAKANPVPSRTTHNTFIEVVWTLVPVLILLVIAVPSIRLLAAQYNQPKADLTIKVIGNQWYWTYQYPDNGDFELVSNMLKEKDEVKPGDRFRTDADGPRLLAVDERIVVPVGAVVKLIVTSNDVIHSFAVPAFWTKMDAVPGRLNETWFKADRPGVYFGQCSELCGARHAYMPIAVEVVEPARFAEWVKSKGGTMPGEAAEAPAGEAAPAANEAAPAEAPAAAPAAAAATTN